MIFLGIAMLYSSLGALAPGPRAAPARSSSRSCGSARLLASAARFFLNSPKWVEAVSTSRRDGRILAYGAIRTALTPGEWLLLGGGLVHSGRRGVRARGAEYGRHPGRARWPSAHRWCRADVMLPGAPRASQVAAEL